MQKFDISGMSCAACSARVERAVKSLPAVEEVQVNLLTDSMKVSGNIAADEIIKAVEAAGYGASLSGGKTSTESRLPNSKLKGIKARLIASVIILIGLMYVSMGHIMLSAPMPAFFSDNAMALGLLELILSGAILIINQRFFKSGARGIINRAPNMDTLVALGSAAAFGYSIFELFLISAGKHNHLIHELYFESAAMILTLITVGKLLEELSKGKTTSALEELKDLSPKMATVIRGDKEISIPAEEVRVGDIFILRPGSAVPADGEVIEGESYIDESSLTGESVPTEKTLGSPIFTATVNQSGFLKCRANKVGENTVLSEIIKTVTDASAGKAPIAKAADRVAGIFVPAIILIAVITLAIWLILGESFGFSIERAISVLVISCPCALGLATPVAIMVGSGIGAKRGILFKTAEALEITGRAKTVVFDKTGTLTKGTPDVTEIIPAEGIAEQELLSAAFSLEQKSEHPIARAIIKYGEEKGLKAIELTDFSSSAGLGIKGKLSEISFFGGNRVFIEKACEIPKEFLDKSEELSLQGKTPLYFGKDNKFLGIIALADTLKPDSIKAVKRLKKMGVRVVMLTGDNKLTAKAIAEKAGIDSFSGGLMPKGKCEEIERLQSQGERVIMVGDGINDAPALTVADIGIAIGAGTDIAMDAADVVLMRKELEGVADAIALSRKTLRTIHQNLFWAFIYNAIGIPLAAGAFISLFSWELNPMFGAAAMSFSSVCVVSNALRLNFIKLSKNSNSKEKKRMEKILKIEGMMCEHCEARVKKLLEGLPQVDMAEVSHKEGTAKLSLNSDIGDAELKKLIEDDGYKVI